MERLDLYRLRKAAGISQRDLAERLAVRPSFLSAIENGKSRFPDDKLEKLKEILGIDDAELARYVVEDKSEAAAVPPHTHAAMETDPIAELLRHIHDQAHKDERSERANISELEDRIWFLSRRNDSLSERLDDLRNEVDGLRQENFRLKELLLRGGIDYRTNPETETM